MFKKMQLKIRITVICVQVLKLKAILKAGTCFISKVAYTCMFPVLKHNCKINGSQDIRLQIIGFYHDSKMNQLEIIGVAIFFSFSENQQKTSWD